MIELILFPYPARKSHLCGPYYIQIVTCIPCTYLVNSEIS